jgi:hypothetical protein
MANGKGGGYVGFAKDALIAGAAAAAIDGISEVSKAPFLNDQAPIFGQANMSNSEAILYVAGGLTAVLGAVAAVTRKRIMGFGPELLATGAGLLVGTSVYENHIAPMVVRGREMIMPPAAPMAPATAAYGYY